MGIWVGQPTYVPVETEGGDQIELNSLVKEEEVF